MADVNGPQITMGKNVEGVVVTRGGTQWSLWSSGKQVRQIALRKMPQRDKGIQALFRWHKHETGAGCHHKVKHE